MDTIYKNSIYYNPSAFKKLKIISSVIDADKSSNFEKDFMRNQQVKENIKNVKKTGKKWNLINKGAYKTMKYSYSNINGKKHGELIVDDSEKPMVVKYVFFDKKDINTVEKKKTTKSKKNKKEKKSLKK